MVWFNVDDGLHDHPKIRRAGNAAMGAWVRMGSYCARYLTDGFVEADIAARYGTPNQIAALVKVGLLRKVRGGYQLHQYLAFNRSKAQVEADREAGKERAQRWRATQKRNAVRTANVRRTNSVRTGAQASVPYGTDSGGAVPAPRAATCIEHMLELPCRGCAADKIAKDG